MPEVKLVQSLEVANELGEGVLWDQRTQMLWWTDIQQKCLYCWQFDGKPQRYPLPERLGSFGLSADPTWFVCAFESGFALYSPEQQALTWLHKIEQDLPQTRLNDGRVDRQGRFWAGSMNEAGRDKIGALYRLDRQGVSRQHTGVQISNGLCWSQSGEQMYFADSPSRVIQRFTFDTQSGHLGEQNTFVNTESGAYPDGACVDAQDNIWSAQWGSGKVRCYQPTGEVLLEVELPCPQPSCVAFGGPDFRHLFVTTARENMSDEALARWPQSGNLFVFETDLQGLPESVCTQHAGAGESHE